MNQVTGLVTVGRLGRVTNGEVQFKPGRNFLPDFLHCRNVFLLFPEEEVYYVMLTSSRRDGAFWWLTFSPDVSGEISHTPGVRLALEQEEVDGVDEESLVDYTVWENGVLLGTVTQEFFNGAQRVITVKANDGEFMLPLVADYMDGEPADGRLSVQNTTGLRQTCK